MENFDSGSKKIKEKSVYSLHLDSPRIIIVGSIIIGLLIVSFLVGMNYFKDDNGSRKIISGNDLFNDKNRDLAFTDKSGPLPLDNKEVNDRFEDSESKTALNEKENKTGEQPVKGKKEAVDVLTSDNINEIIPSKKKNNDDKDVKDNAEKDSGKDKKTARKKINSEKKKDADNTDAEKSSKKKRNKSKVVEVSDDADNGSRKSGHYAIQVASFDKKAKANEEIKLLKEKNYDAHVNSTDVNGEKFFRVKIGPIASKKKAIKMLNEIQEISRYRDSYMTRE